MVAFRIWKIGAPLARGQLLWWPVFERFDDGSPDSPPIAYCSGPLQHRIRKGSGRYSSDNAHRLIDSLRGEDA